MAQELKEELGRLSGLLSALGPELDRIEGRERENATQMATVIERVGQLRKDFDQLVGKVSVRFKTLFDKVNAQENGRKDLGNSIGILDGRLRALEDMKKGWTKKVWEVAKILLAAVAGAWVSSKFGVKP